jgi:DNA-binding NarL/FixJ family response regulator
MRILLADHHPQALWALRISLDETPEFDVVGEATDADGLIALLPNTSPHLVLMDWELPGKPVEDLIAELHQAQAKPFVVVMSSKPEYGRMLLNAGADAFVSKCDQPDWLLDVLHKFARRN